MAATEHVIVGEDAVNRLTLGNDRPMALIAGPCAMDFGGGGRSGRRRSSRAPDVGPPPGGARADGGSVAVYAAYGNGSWDCCW